MELLDLYSENKERTGKTAVRGSKIDKGYYKLVVLICIFNSNNQMLIQQRQVTKKDWANLWNLSVAGSAIVGETSKMAAERELKEELGIELVLDGCQALSFCGNGVFCDYYIINKDIKLSDIKLQDEEVKAVKWATKDEIFNMINDSTFLPYRKPVIELLFLMKDGFGDLEIK